ncbi:MAG: carboxypeptidase-like regulatory domain-containing protein [Emticicia sp.]|nr:carboxypeptidase-like regulatory domain-containing protein [Emticicia sp.]
MKNILLILIIAQNFVLAQTLIKDSNSKEPIPYVSVSRQNGTGTYSNEDGSFELLISSSDTLYISHLAYKSIKLTKSDIDNLTGGVIYLVPKSFQLSEVQISQSRKSEIDLGYYYNKTFFNRTGPGGKNDFSVFVNHLKNTANQQGYLEKLYFDLHVDLTEKSNSKARIRVFSVGEDGLPKDDLLNKEIIKRIDRLTPNLQIDVSEFNIVFPLNGVFIGLEFFCNYEQKEQNRRGNYKTITNCPHIETAKVLNSNVIGESYFWSIWAGKMQWVCYSDGTKMRGAKGHVFKFGAKVRY